MTVDKAYLKDFLEAGAAKVVAAGSADGLLQHPTAQLAHELPQRPLLLCRLLTGSNFRVRSGCQGLPLSGGSFPVSRVATLA